MENGNRCHFLDLPAELENLVYSIVLIERARMPLPTPKGKVPEPFLLAVNLQFRTEAIPVFYGGTTFASINQSATDKFLEQLDGERTSLLNKLEIRTFDCGDYFPKSHSMNLKWLRTACQQVNELALKYGKVGLQRDIFWVPDFKEFGDELLCRKSTEIEEFKVVDEGEGWRVEWKGT